jgi:hypothetical protein
LHGLFPIPCNVEIGLYIRCLDRLADEKHVGRIVFDDQDVKALARPRFRPGG